ncbi:MAG TPA: N-6 DNA methylase [Ilumatobacter sp.]|jgi:SAM-dependent methyltransferase|nr:N-6 DNA methylase [Ilumatobacter sp.]
MPRTQAARKLLGAWYTPAELIDTVVSNVLRGLTPVRGRAVRVLDPACGDGRFLFAVAGRLRDRGVPVELTGCDVDSSALAAIAGAARTINDDALSHEWDCETFDIVVGNPPFLSQMAAATTRGGASRHGGGPYADAAVEFLALAVRLARADGGRVGLVLPQSIVGARDAAPVRAEVARVADLTWSWWAPRQRHFDAAVNVCALGFERRAHRRADAGADVWTGVVTDRLGIPPVDCSRLAVAGTLGDRAAINANFRDEYYALVPAVHEGGEGPPLVTSGLIDPGACLWGRRPMTFARRTFTCPRVDLAELTGRFPRWAERKLVPKVLVANQTRILEAVADRHGAWLPGVPVNTVTPVDGASVDEIAAVITSPVASVLAWHAAAGTGLSTTSVRVGPALLAQLPWPCGNLALATAALASGDIEGCGRAVTEAYAIDRRAADCMLTWWRSQLPPRA